MIKSKSKFLLLLVIIITLVSTLSFATVEPRTSDESDIMPISETDETTPIAETPVEENEEPEWVNSDLYIAEDNYVLDKIVDGNAYIIADEVVISGEIGGNVFVCANKLTVEGAYIYNGLYAIANEITLNGIIYDVYAISDVLNLETDGYIYRDLRAMANTFNINGKIGRDALISGSTFNFSSENSPLIGRNLEYSSNSEAIIPEGLVVGEVKFNVETVETEDVVSKVFSYIFDALNNLVFTFVVILLALWLAPKFTDRVASMDTKKAFVCLGIGIVAPIAIIITLMLLLLSMACANLALAATFVFIAICMSGTAFASIYFGSLFAKLVKWEGKVKFVLATLIASLIIWAISQLPYIGGLFGFLVALFGIGTLLVNIIYRKEKVESVKEDNSEESAQ